MSIDHAVFGNYKRKFIVAKSALEKIRRYLPGLAHRTDLDLSNLVDEAVRKEGLDSAEVFWENDFAYGVQKNRVVKLDKHILESDEQLFAVVRDTESDGPIVITVLSAESKEAAEKNRWSTENPDVDKKIKRERTGNGINRPFEKLASAVDSVEVKQVDNLITYHVKDSKRLMQVGPQYETKTLQEGVSKLVEMGVNPASIYVWEKSPVQVKVKIELAKL